MLNFVIWNFTQTRTRLALFGLFLCLMTYQLFLGYFNAKAILLEEQ